MDRPTYMGFTGYHSPRPLFTINENRFIAQNEFDSKPDRVCIHLCKPEDKTLSITRSKNDHPFGRIDSVNTVRDSEQSEGGLFDVATTTGDIENSDKSADRFAIAGVGKDVIKYYYTDANTPVAVEDRDSPFGKHIQFRLKTKKEAPRRRSKFCQELKTPEFTFKVADLSSVLHSQYEPQNVTNKKKSKDFPDVDSATDFPGPVKKAKIQEPATTASVAGTDGSEKIYCVLQAKNTTCDDEFECRRTPGPGPLRCHCPFCFCFTFTGLQRVKDAQLWKQMTTVLPRETFIRVMQFMHYDQVSWFADKDAVFARSLAYHRYGVFDSFDETKYPDLRSVIVQLRVKNSLEMRFNGHENLWICSSVHNGRLPRGTCIPYNIQEGTYTWWKAATMTALKFDGRTQCMCKDCVNLLINLHSTMNDHQICNLIGTLACKVFALKGSEDTPIDMDVASVYWKEEFTSDDFNHRIHMWTDDVDHRWLQNVRFELNDGPLTVDDFKKIQKFGTLIFKDPVKFFTVPKTLCFIDTNVAALLSACDHEVLGYTVMEKNYRFRYPIQDFRQAIIGLNFFPQLTIMQCVRTSHLVRHVYQHDMEYTMRVLLKEASLLTDQLENSQLGHIERYIKNRKLDCVNEKLSKLQLRISQKSMLRNPEVQREKPADDNTLHEHETYSGGFEFCSRYFFVPLDTTDTVVCRKNIFDFMVKTCGVNSCNLGIIDRGQLEAFMGYIYGDRVRPMVDDL